jgi:proline iminopeptidase
MATRTIRGVPLNVEITGNGPPLALMHGGPGADLWTLLPFRRLADRFTLVFYDHRCNGGSGGDLDTLTWENLTADADALRESLGFERWSVLGHSFGGHVALEYALRYPDRLERLVLLDTGGDARWSRERAAARLERRGFSPRLAALTSRYFTGRMSPAAAARTLLRLGDAYHHLRGMALLRLMGVDLIRGEWRSKLRTETLMHAGRELVPGWTVMDRLGEIRAPTLVIGGRDDFIFPPEHQAAIAAGIPDSRLWIVERAGHNPHSERSEETMLVVSTFLGAAPERPALPALVPWRQAR